MIMITQPKFTNSHLVARLCPDPLGELTAAQDALAGLKVSPRKGETKEEEKNG